MNGTASSATFKVGDKVWVRMATGRAAGTVTEDRGSLGRGGRRLFYVSVPNHPYSSDVLLLGEDEMEPMTADERTTLYEPLDPQAVKDFLIHGGLFAILARNSQQPVWLRRGPRGSLTQTYIEGYSVTGGESPPLSALHGEKIFTPKRDAVIRFLKSFGLTDDEAGEVVRRVGTAP